MLQTLDHYTIRARDLAASLAFYVEVLGLTDGERPPFSFPGAWLYLDGRPVVHLVGGDNAPEPHTGAIDHVAFRGQDYDGYTRRLAGQDIRFRQRKVPDRPLRQIFLTDPDGIVIELNFWDE